MFRSVVVAVFLSLVACGPGEKHNDNGTTFLLPWSDTSTGQLKFEHVHIQTLRNPNKVEGPVAKVYINAGMTERGFSGSVAEPRWAKSGSVYIPRDVKSGQALATYAHFEKIFFMDVKLGITHLSRWPQEVSLRAASDRRTNNALYYPQPDVTLVTAYTLQQHPLSLNRFVLGHEHFHAMFVRAFTNPRLKVFRDKNFEPPKLYIYSQFPFMELSVAEHNYFAALALNEGLADFFGYIYSNDPGAIDSSFAAYKADRRLDDLREDSSRLLTEEEWNKLMSELPNEKDPNCVFRTCRVYYQGIRYARTLYKLSLQKKDVVSSREILAKKILMALPKVAERFAEAEIRDEKVHAEKLLGWLYEEMQIQVVSP